MGTAVKYGIICGLLTCFWIMSEFLLGFHNEHYEIGKYSGYLAAVIPFVTVFLGLKEKRQQNIAAATFPRLFGTGVVLVLISATIIAVFMWAYNSYINPDWQNIIVSKEAERMMMEGVSPEELLAKADQYRMMSKPSVQFGMVFGGTFLMGTLIALIYAFILRKKSSVEAI